MNCKGALKASWFDKLNLMVRYHRPKTVPVAERGGRGDISLVRGDISHVITSLETVCRAEFLLNRHFYHNLSVLRHACHVAV